MLALGKLWIVEAKFYNMDAISDDHPTTMALVQRIPSPPQKKKFEHGDSIEAFWVHGA